MDKDSEHTFQSRLIDPSYSGLCRRYEDLLDLYDKACAERDQLQGEVGALREERETLLTRITELEAAIADALEQLRALQQEIA